MKKVAALVLLVFATMAFAQLGDVIKSLDLSKEQQAEIKKLDQTWKPIQMDAKASMKENKNIDIFQKEGVSRKDLEKSISAIQDTQREMQTAKINYMLDIRDILTEEQQKKFTPILGKMLMTKMNPQSISGRNVPTAQSAPNSNSPKSQSEKHDCSKH